MFNYDDNSRLAILLYNYKNNYCDDLTINLPKFLIANIDEGFINGDINFDNDDEFNVVNQLKKDGVIKESYGFRRYNYGSYEYVKFDLEKLRLLNIYNK